MASKQELEEMLRAVQDLKSEHYVGTQEAYNTIKAMYRMRVFPDEVARIINEQLPNRLGQREITYPATGERVSGLADILLYAYKSAGEDFKDLDDDNPEIYLTENFPGVLSHYYAEYTSQDKPKDLADSFLGFFAYANINTTNNDDVFGVDVEKYIRIGYNSVRNKIENPMIDNCDEFVDNILRNIRNDAWDYELSKKARFKRETIERRNIFSGYLLRDKIVERLINDKYDQRFEYRRQVLCHWLNSQKPFNYKSAIKLANKQLSNARRILEKLRGKAPEVIQRNQENLVQSAEFVRHVLGSEKNFIEKYLRS